MAQEVDGEDDFFGIHEATETPLPRHMEAAKTLRSRTAVKKRHETSDDRTVPKQRSAHFGSMHHSEPSFSPKSSTSQLELTGNSSTAVDTSGIDYIDSLYFGNYEGIDIGGNDKVLASETDTSGTDYIDLLYFGDFLANESKLSENKANNDTPGELMIEEPIDNCVAEPYRRRGVEDISEEQWPELFVPGRLNHAQSAQDPAKSNPEKECVCSGSEFIDLQYFPDFVEAESKSQPPSGYLCDVSEVTEKRISSGSSNQLEAGANVPESALRTERDRSGTDFIDSQYFRGLVGDEGDSPLPKGENSPAGLESLDFQADAFENAVSEAEFIKDPSFWPTMHRLKSQSNEKTAEGFALDEGNNEDGTNDGDVRPLEMVELKKYTDNGLGRIWEKIDPVWKMNDEQLIDMMLNRIVYEDEELIAFDKPYQMAYSHAPSNQAELSRILPKISSRVTPRHGHLRIVKSIAKPVTGVILFAKNENAEKKVKFLYENGSVEQCYRVITNMMPEHQEATIDIPLIKCRRKNNNYMMLPVGASNNELTVFSEATTHYRVIKHDNKNHTSYMECTLSRDVPEQVRAHLGIGLACPVVGDIKYNYSRREAGRGIPPRLSDGAMQDLNITGNAFRRLPMYIHLKEVIIPLQEQSSRKIHIRAPLPSFFTYTLKKLRLFRK